MFYICRVGWFLMSSWKDVKRSGKAAGHNIYDLQP